jgi:ABC-2 type transport system permease protein
LRGEVTLAVANGLYLVLLLLGGMAFPLSELPDGLRAVAEILPAAALTELLTAATAGTVADARWWLTLAAWAIAAPTAAAATFRWH